MAAGGECPALGSCGTGAALAPQASPPSARHGCTCPPPLLSPGAGWTQTPATGAGGRQGAGAVSARAGGNMPHILVHFPVLVHAEMESFRWARCA